MDPGRRELAAGVSASSATNREGRVQSQMLKQYSSVQVAAWWCFAVAAIAASAVALGGAVATRSLVILFAFMMVMPVAILMALWRSGPSPSMKDLLTASDRGSEERS